MAKQRKFTVKEVIDALIEKEGFVGNAAILLGCSPSTLYNYRDRYPSVAETLEAIREKRHDKVEGKLMELIEQGNVTAILFYLKCQCKNRGYVERTDVVAVSVGESPEPSVVIYIPDNGRGDGDVLPRHLRDGAFGN